MLHFCYRSTVMIRAYKTATCTSKEASRPNTHPMQSPMTSNQNLEHFTSPTKVQEVMTSLQELIIIPYKKYRL